MAQDAPGQLLEEEAQVGVILRPFPPPPRRHDRVVDEEGRGGGGRGNGGEDEVGADVEAEAAARVEAVATAVAAIGTLGRALKVAARACEPGQRPRLCWGLLGRVRKYFYASNRKYFKAKDLRKISDGMVKIFSKSFL